MATTKNANYKVYNGVDYDLINLTTTATNVSIADSGGVITATNVEDALQETVNKIGILNNLPTTDKTNVVNSIKEINTDLTTHSADNVSHITSTERTTWNGKIDKSLLSSIGDIIYASAIGTPARLGKGTAYQVLGMNSDASAPQYMASLQSLITASGDLIYGSAPNTVAKLAKGSDGQGLILNGGLPVWGSIGTWQRIASVKLIADQASIIFDNIPSTYKTLKVITSCMSNGAVANLNITFNTGVENVINRCVRYSGTDTGVTGQSNLSTLSITNALSEDTGSVNGVYDFTQGEIIVNNIIQDRYSKTGQYSFASSTVIQTGGFVWKNNASLISKITLAASSQQIRIGSQFELWGLL